MSAREGSQARTRRPGIKTIKRSYVNARVVYEELDAALRDLQRAAAHLPDGILAPAIDLLFDRRDAAAVEYRRWFDRCRERNICSAYGYGIYPSLVPLEDE